MLLKSISSVLSYISDLQINSHSLSVAALTLLCCTAIAYYCCSMYISTVFFSHKSLLNFDFQPPVSILKPICGLDDDSYQNFASFCHQNYATYQIIFAVQNPFDPCISIVKQLIKDFPERDIQIVISDRTIGTNLKVSNLANALPQAKYEILLLVDSDIRVQPDYLGRVVEPLRDPSVGVVTCMYRSQALNAIAAFEALSISTEFLPSVLVARQLEGMSFAFGATIVLSKSVLAEIGGFAAIANYLVDDFKLGNLPAQAGYKVVLSDYVVDHTLGTSTIAGFLLHQTRWLRGNRSVRPWGYLGLIFTYGTVSSLLLLVATQGATLAWMMFGAVLVTRSLMSWTIGVYYLKDTVAKRFFWLAPVRDVVSFALWCYGFTGNSVIWRGQRFMLSKSGLMSLPIEWGAIETSKL